MKNEHHKSSNNFFSGFMLGVIVGGLVVFLFATEKGRRIFKILKEEGMKGTAELEELLDEEISEEGPESVPSEPSNHSNGQSIIQKTQATGKKLFKGIGKKS